MTQIQSIYDTVDLTLISSRNQTVVPAKVRHILGLKPGDKLTWKIVKVGNEPKIIAEKEPKSWAAYTRGLGKYTWKNINVDEYIKNLRQEWEE